MPSGFDIKPYQKKITTLKSLHIEENANRLAANRLAAKFNKLVLKSDLDLSSHLVHTSFNLSPCHAFNNIVKFCHAVNTSKRAQILYLLAKMIAYNVATHEKTTQ